MKRILPIVLGVFVFLTAALLIGPSLINWNKYKPEIIEKAKSAGGYDVAIDGDIRLSLIPAPSLKLEGLKVRAPRGEEQYLLQMDRADVSVELLPLLGGQVNINTVSLVNPDIRLEKLANGEVSWTAQDASVPQASSDAALSSGGAFKTSSPDISLNKLLIENGQVSYSDATSGAVYKARNINADLKADSLSAGPYKADGSLIYNGLELAFSAQTGGPVNAKKEVPVKLALSLPKLNASAQYKGILAMAQTPEIQGSVEIQADSLASVLVGLGGGQANPALAQKLSLSGLVTANDHEISVQGIETGWGEAKGRGNLVLTNLKAQDPVKLQADLAFEGTLDLDRLGAAAKNGGEGTSVEERVAKGEKLSAQPGILPETLALPFPVDGAVKLSADNLQFSGKSFKGVAMQLEKMGNSVDFLVKVIDMPGKSSADLKGNLRYATYARQGGKGGVYHDPTLSWTATGTSEQLPSLLRAFVKDQDSNPAFEIWKTARFDLGGVISPSEASLVQSVVKLDEATFGLNASYRPEGAGGLPDAVIDLATDQIDIDYIQSRLNGQKKPAVQKEAEQKKDTKKTAAASVMDVNIPLNLSFDLSAQKAIWNAKEINGIRIKGKASGESLSLENASAQDYMGAAASLRGRIDKLSDLSGIDLKFYGKTGNLRALMEAFQIDPAKLPSGISSAEANIQAKGAQKELAFDASVKAMSGQLDATGTVMDLLSGLPRFDNLTVGVKHPNLVKAVQLLNPEFSGGPGLEKPFEFDAKAVRDGSIYNLSGMKATLGTTFFSGDLKIDTSNPAKASVSGAISAGNIPLDSLLAADDGAGKGRAGGASNAAYAAGGDKWSRNTLETGWMQTVNLDLDLSAQSIVYGGWNLQSPKTRLSLKDGTLLVDNLQAGLFGGQAALTAKVQDPADPKQPLSLILQSKMTQIGLEPLMYALSGTNRLKASGSVSLDMNVQTLGLSPYALVSGLQGKAAVSGKEVVMKGFDLAQIALAFVDTGKPMDRLSSVVSGATSGGETRFDTITGGYNISQGVVTIVSMNMDGPAATIVSTGNANLPLWTIDTNHAITLKQAKDAGTFNVAIKGPLSNPGNTFGKALFNDVLTRRLQQKATEKLPDVLGDDLSGKLQGLGILPQQQKQQQDSGTGKEQTTPSQQNEQQKQKTDPEKAIKGVLDGLLR